jgi:molecular chaperone DnaJ
VQSAGILRVQTTCPSCRGAGSVIHDPCQGCGGSGYATEVVKRRIAVPAGVDDGMKVRIPGEGNPSPSGGPPGDCYCFVSVRPHPLFHREGPHLICSIPITYSQATLGATLEVPTLDGRRDLPIPAGTQAKEVFRLPRLGVPDVRNRGASGDLLVQVELEVPKKLSERQEELLRELAEEEHANVSEHRKSFFEKVRDFFIPDDLPQPTGSEKEV